MVVGILLIIIGVIIFVTYDKDQGIFKMWEFELTAAEPILLIVFGSILLIIPWLPQIIHRPREGIVQKTPEGEFEIIPHSKKIERGNEVILSEAQVRFLLPPNENDWEVISAEEYQAIDDVSIWDLPLFSTSRAAFLPAASAQGKIIPLSHYFLRHQGGIEVMIGEESLVDNFNYSGKLPHQQEFTDRALDAGIALMILPQIRLAINADASTLEEFWEEFEIEEPIPIQDDGNTDIESALNRIHRQLYEQAKSEGAGVEITEAFKAMKRKDLPTSRKLYHSASVRIYRQEDILNSDPFLKLMWGDELSMWQFLNSLLHVDPDINLSNIENMKWNENGATVSFTLSTQLDDVQIGEKNTSLTIRRLFFITKDAQRFHLLRINLLSGPGTYEKAAYDGLRKLLGSYRVGIPQITDSNNTIKLSSK
jgi:hypothetical protein